MSLPIKCLEFVAILVVSADTGLLEGILPRWTSCSDVGGLLGLFRKGHSMQRTSRSG